MFWYCLKHKLLHPTSESIYFCFGRKFEKLNINMCYLGLPSETMSKIQYWG